MERGLDLGCLIAMQECKSRSKIFKVKIIFNFFSKRVFSMIQESGIILSEKFFSDFQTNQSPGIAMRSQRQKLPFTCNQRRRTLPVRITWKGDWTSGVSLRCKSASRGQKFSAFFSKRVFSMIQDSGIILSDKNFFRLSDQSESRHRNEIPKAEAPLYM